jgi:hypothetical protein
MLTNIMMKRTLQYCLILTLIFSGCATDPVNEMINPDRRLSQVLQEYHEKLVGSPFGWKAFLYPGEGGGFNFFMEFSEEGRVSMVADITDETASVPYESSYRMEATQRPSLFFDTYTYLHYLADPDPEVNGGIEGHGYISDFEFSFESTSGDTIRLIGNQNKSELILVKASQKENQWYKAARLKTIRSEIGQYRESHPYMFLLAADNRKTGVSLNPYTRSFSIVEEDDDDLRIGSTRFSFTPTGILLREPMKFRDVTFKEVFIDTASNKLYIRSSANQRIDIKVLTEPIFPMHKMIGVEFVTVTLKPDPVNSPGWSSFFQNTWISIDDGLDNCCGLRLSDIQFIFNTATRQMDINVYVRNVSAGQSFRLRYPYRYTVTGNGVFTFSKNPDEEPNYNGQYLASVLAPLLDEITDHKYKMNYLKTETGFSGQMTSQDFSAFYFAGELR